MIQQSLFAETGPNKIKLVRDFISDKEESFLLKKFETLDWQKIKFHGVIAKRRVVHFGLDYIYAKRAISRAAPPPPKWLDFLIDRVAKLIKVTPAHLEEILVTHYPAGAGIGWHKDAEVFGDSIIGVSLLSDCTMNFRHPETHKKYQLFIPRRSAYVISGEARQIWQHAITNHSEDRYSVTFRTLDRS